MTLSDLAALGSFISSLAVVLSLLFLYFQLRQISQQVRQTEKNQKAAIMQGRATHAIDILAIGADSSIAETVNKGMRGDDDMSETGLRQFEQYSRAIFWAWEDAFCQHADGLYSDSAFERLKINVEGLAKNIGVQAQWRLQRRTFAPAFVTWVDQLVAETPVDKSDPLVLWRAVAKELRVGVSP